MLSTRRGQNSPTSVPPMNSRFGTRLLTTAVVSAITTPGALSFEAAQQQVVRLQSGMVQTTGRHGWHSALRDFTDPNSGICMVVLPTFDRRRPRPLALELGKNPIDAVAFLTGLEAAGLSPTPGQIAARWFDAPAPWISSGCLRNPIWLRNSPRSFARRMAASFARLLDSPRFGALGRPLAGRRPVRGKFRVRTRHRPSLKPAFHYRFCHPRVQQGHALRPVCPLAACGDEFRPETPLALATGSRGGRVSHPDHGERGGANPLRCT